MNIAKIHASAEAFHLLGTTGCSQTASISLEPGNATSDEPNSHPQSDQVMLIKEGQLMAPVGDERETVQAGDSLIIPAGVRHRFKNTGHKTTVAFSVYAPPAYQTGDPT